MIEVPWTVAIVGWVVLMGFALYGVWMIARFITQLFHFRKPVPAFTVQLHVMTLNKHSDDAVIVSSWAPIFVRGEEAANQQRRDLYESNRWGSTDRWPYVEVTPLGEDQR